MSGIYWEKQESALCGVHALNNLLQGSYYSAGDLSLIAQELDETEKKLMLEAGMDSNSFLSYMAREGSQNVDLTGNFSLQVLKQAIENFGLRMINLNSEECKGLDPLSEVAFIANYKSHWFSLRKIKGVWYNLNSFNESGPSKISDFYLSAYLAQLRTEGYSLFVVRGAFPYSSGSESSKGMNEGVIIGIGSGAAGLSSSGPLNNMNPSNPIPKPNRNVHNPSSGPIEVIDPDLEAAIKLSLQQPSSSPFQSLSSNPSSLPASLNISGNGNNSNSGINNLSKNSFESRPRIDQEDSDSDDPELKAALALSLASNK